MTKVMLCLMVKDEAHVIERCLDAALPFIDAMSIVDTGSSDDTVAVTQTWALEHEMPFRITDAKWFNFAENRNIALSRAQREAIFLEWEPEESYALVLDADDVIHGQLFGFLDLPGYHVTCKLAGIEYQRLLLLRLNARWRYVDVQHAIAVDGGVTGHVEGLWVESVSDGSSWLAQDQEKKFMADAERILEAYESEHDGGLRARYQFYLGQSFRDAGHDDKARYWYEQRVDNPDGYADERCVAALELGKIRLRGHGTNWDDEDEALYCFLRAVELGPQRPEGWYHAASYLRAHERYRLGYLLAEEAFRLADADKRAQVLFAELEAWRWGPVFEMSICAYYSPERKRVEEGYECARFLREEMTDVPDNVASQNLVNLESYRSVHGLP